MRTERQNQSSGQQKGSQREAQDTNRQDSSRQDTSRRDEDLSQGSETLDDALQEDQRDHSDNGRGQRGVLNR
jgi:hypothetical protein